MRRNQFTLSVSYLALLAVIATVAQPQSAPNVSQVVLYSTVRSGSQTVNPSIQANSFNISNPVLGLYSLQSPVGGLGIPITSGGGSNPTVAGQITNDLTSALNANIATALSTIPLASPASGVILKRDSNGAAVPASSTLGPVFTERAETVGKGHFYLGVTNQSFHFGSISGASLNGIQLLFKDQITSSVGPGLKSNPATFQMGLDVRLSQSTAFMSYGITNRFDVSLGLPMVHSAVAARTYDAKVYTGDGQGQPLNGQPNCWCAGSLVPGQNVPRIDGTFGAARYSSTGFGDVLLRFKGIAKESSRGVLAIGADLRLPSGDANNYHGIGTTAVKPFAAFSWFPKALSNRVIFAPHVYVGWQFAGKSILGGQFQATQQTTTISYSPTDNAARVQGTVSYLAPGFSVPQKDYLPDVLSWTVGTEVAFGQHQTFIFDILANQVGLAHGVRLLQNDNLGGQTFLSPLTPGATPQTATATAVSGYLAGAKGSYGQYNGSFGYKAKIVGNLVLTFNALVRFDSNGLTARFVPLYGVGYSF